MGPFLVLGLRDGLIGVQHPGSSYTELRPIVETASIPPRSCFIDGIQFASCCTFGKGKIEFRPQARRVAVTFTRKGRGVELVTGDAVLKGLE
jgi:formylmethanofuran dehydrogenase subunit E